MHDLLMWAGSIIIGAVFSLIGWVFKMVFDAIKEQEQQHRRLSITLQDHKLHAAENFVTKVDMSSFVDRVMVKLDKLDEKFDVFGDKLDKKADKRDD